MSSHKQQLWFAGVDISTAVYKDQMGYKLIDQMSPCPHPCLAGSFIQGTCDIVSCEARLFWSVPPQFEVYRIFVFILISHSVPMPISLLLQLQVRVEKVIAGWENESEQAREGGGGSGELN